MQASLVAQLGEQNQIKPRKLSRSGLFLGLTVCSLLLHGVLLGLPWPEVEFSEEATSPSPPDPELAMDVAILPSGTLQQPGSEESAPTEQPPDPPAATPERSPQTTSPQAAPSSPPAELDQRPPTPLPITEPPPPPSSPVDELPPESGSSDPLESDPVTPPTLQERLQDVGAYQHDGTKNLGVGVITEGATWAVAGQTYPSKADTLELPYELGDTCLDNAPLRGTLMVVVDEVGNFMRGPEVISSTGYDVLDDYAEDFVRTGKYRLPEEGGPKAYSVDIEVLYPDTCP